MPTDTELLRQYVKDGSEAAFTEIVLHHAGLVYSVALRLVGGNQHLAKDVTQEVFILLARKAPMLIGHETLAGWLHTTTRYVANSMIRSLRRQENREQEAVAMQTNSTPDVQWEQLRPLLDEAVGQLDDRDRNAVLLRYFEGKNYNEIGAALSLTENSARARTERAVEKLRRHFARNGVVTTGALLAEVLTANTAQAAPAGLADEVAAMAHAKGVSLGPVLSKTLYMSTKTKLIIAAAFVLLVLGIYLSWPAGSAPATAAEPAQPAIVQTPTAPRLPVQAAKPTTPPTPITSKAPPPSLALSPEDAQKKEVVIEMKALLSNIVQDLRTGQGLWDYFTPDDLRKRGFTPEIIASARALQASVLNNSSSLPKNIILWNKSLMDGQALSFEALEDQTPIINATGDEVTYQQVGLTEEDMDKGEFSGKGEIGSRTFVKIQGRWYLKPLPDTAPEPNVTTSGSLQNPFAP